MAASITVGGDVHAVTLCALDTPHRLSVVGYLRGSRPQGLDCDRPLRVVCRRCDYSSAWACKNHRSSRCKPCSRRYRLRVGEVALSGLSRGEGVESFVTFTAPGREAHRLPSGALCPCTPAGGIDVAEWNAGHSARWNHLVTLLRREYPGLQYWRGVEAQDGKRRRDGDGRGALHDHGLFRTPVRMRTAVVRRLAMQAGFGHAVKVDVISGGVEAVARYASKMVAAYTSKSTDLRAEVPWAADVVDERTGEVSRGLVDGRYRTWSCSRSWGVTMAAVQARAAAYAATRRALAVELVDGEALGLVESVLGAVRVADPPAD